MIDLFLRVAENLKGDGLGEFEKRTAVEPGERLTIELERDGHDGPRLLAVDLFARFAEATDGADFRVFEDRGVKLRGFFGLGVEPEAGGDFLDGGH